jgi:hypothetical protein
MGKGRARKHRGFPVIGFDIRVVMMPALVARNSGRSPDVSESEGAVQLAMSSLIALRFAAAAGPALPSPRS